MPTHARLFLSHVCCTRPPSSPGSSPKKADKRNSLSTGYSPSCRQELQLWIPLHSPCVGVSILLFGSKLELSCELLWHCLFEHCAIPSGCALWSNKSVALRLRSWGQATSEALNPCPTQFGSFFLQVFCKTCQVTKSSSSIGSGSSVLDSMASMVLQQVLNDHLHLLVCAAHLQCVDEYGFDFFWSVWFWTRACHRAIGMAQASVP